MAVSRELDDGPFVLQLWKWQRLPLHFELSKFQEAFISPTRHLLALLSSTGEAVLLSLNTGVPVTPIADLKSSEVETHAAFSDSGDLPVFECCSYISSVESLAWGHCFDASSQLEDSIFRELLVVSGDGDIIVHAFPHSYKNTESQIINSGHDVGLSHERKEWGPNQRSMLKDGGFCPFRSFLVAIDASVSNGMYEVRFPAKSALHHPAEAVSFSIHETTLSFMKFHSSYFSLNSKTEIGSSGSPQSFPSRVPASGKSCSCQCKCSRVFASSSGCLIGLVLTSANKSTINCEVHPRNLQRVLVVIIELYQWGMQWKFLVDLRDVYPGLALSPEWADFQLSETSLICLNTTGLVCMWDVNSGSLVACVNVVQQCNGDLEMSGGRTLPLVTNLDGENGHRTKINTSETYTGELLGRRAFKRLVLASHSLTVAAVDEFGVSYVFCADDIINCKDIVHEKLGPSIHFDGDGLAAWEAAGRAIGGLIFSSHRSINQELLNRGDSFCDFSARNDTGAVRPRKRRKKHPRFNGSQVGRWPSGFSTATQLKGWANSYVDVVTASSPHRRVILPPYRLQEEDILTISPLGITRISKGHDMDGDKHVKIVHANLCMASSFLDERDVVPRLQGQRLSFWKESTFVGESIGCSFQGYLYLITQDGLSVVLPSVSVSSVVSSGEAVKYWRPDFACDTASCALNSLLVNGSEMRWSPWQIEVLDRALLYEGPMQADRLCWENGWDLKVSRLRRMQLDLHFMKIDDLEQSLNMLVEVNLAEEGVLQLLLASIYHIICRTGSNNEVALSSKLMALAVCFATKMIKCYGQLEQKKDVQDNSRRLHEMAYLLEVIRILQNRVTAKGLKSVRMADSKNATSVNTEMLQNESSLPTVVVDSVSSGPLGGLDAFDNRESSSAVVELVPDSSGQLALTPIESSLSTVQFHDVYTNTQGNIRDMMTRWEINNFDLKTIVKEALQCGRLPLAVLHLQLFRQRELVSNEESQDAFSEVHEIGRSIVYDHFIKGETGLAVATLERLGDDVESDLRQLMLGTVRRSLRLQIAEEMEKHGYLRPNELQMLEIILLIERFYPRSSFWGTYLGRESIIHDTAKVITLPGEDKPSLTLHIKNHLPIECGDVDGAVIGHWANVSSRPDLKEFSGNDSSDGYWACAAVWSDAWDQRTVDRIILDQTYHMEAYVRWESKFEYYTAHNNMVELRKLIDMIPASVLSEGILSVCVDNSQAATGNASNVIVPDYKMYIYDAEELEPLSVDVPHVKVFKPSDCESTRWLRMLMEQELVKRHIFLKEYWQSTSEIIPLLARAGILINTSELAPKKECPPDSCDSDLSDARHYADSEGAFHKLVVCYCMQYNLPYLLDLYLEHHNLVQDKDTIISLKEAAGECQWVEWLLFSRVKGCEYEASFCNARWNLSRKLVHYSNLSALEIDEELYTIDDMAERSGETAALATLMYAAMPIQKSLCAGSVNRNCGLSSQCTLENLRPSLQQFPTLWKTLLSACFGQDGYGCLSYIPSNVFGKSSISEYLHWRYNIFSSAGGDSSLLQMLPCWFPKSVRRLIQLFEQGPFGMQLLLDAAASGELFAQSVSSYIFNTTGYSEANALSLEVSIQKSIEEELYSSLEEKDLRVEHHLHRGRALAAFRHLLAKRALQLKSANTRTETSAQSNIQADVQSILAPLSPNERSVLLSVAPLAITNFEDSALVASCVFLLELCGLSANMLRLDTAALQRISSYYKSAEQNIHFELASPRSSTLHALSHGADVTRTLARALAEDYVQSDHLHVLEQNHASSKPSKSKQPLQPLTTILHHLEKASLPSLEEGKTCGFWLSSGVGDASLYRSQQNEASQHWNLVTEFCQAHDLPLSTKYLALLANDNDWVGFLTEAQLGGFPTEVVIQVAAKEIKDSRLKIHILTVLKNMLSARRKVNSSMNISSSVSNGSSVLVDSDNNPMELFGILAECERQKAPGEALLNKAKEMHWSLLALIASCFPDVTPLLCLSVWLEITAARETSLIMEDDISSKIAKNVGYAVEATNRLPSTSRNVEFRYNRRNPKRRRFLEATVENSALGSSLDNTSGSISAVASSSVTSEIIIEEERGKLISEEPNISVGIDERLASLSNMVAVLCEKQLFLPLLRAFEMFLPSCSLLSFIRSLQAFSQMRLSEASAHLASFSARIKDEASRTQLNSPKEAAVITALVTATAVKAADAVLLTCPSIYEKRCLLQLLAAVDFADGGSSSSYFRRRYWKINLAEPSLCKDGDIYLWNDSMDDASLLTALEKNGRWEQARTWARQLESSDIAWKSAVHHVTESQAEAMVAEWKEFLWDVPQERAALWGYCQALFMRYSFPPLQAGLFFLKHAEAIEKEILARELHEMLLLSLQWLSGTITQSPPVYPLHLLREIETRVWLLAVESESQSKTEGEFAPSSAIQNLAAGNSTSIIEQTAGVVTKMDNHISATRGKTAERSGIRDDNILYQRHLQLLESTGRATTTNNTRTKRRAKAPVPQRRGATDNFESGVTNCDDSRISGEQARNLLSEEEFAKMEASLSSWEQNVRTVDMERAVLSLLEFGQITAAKQLQHKLSPSYVPQELVLIDVALKIASNSSSGEISLSCLDSEVLPIVQSLGIASSRSVIDPLQALELLAMRCGEGCGRALCRRIISVVKAAQVLGDSFSEAFEKQPIELLQLLSLKAQDSFEESKLLVETHVMPASSIARILSESFLKGLLAAHRGGYLDSQKEEGPAPLLWRSSDFLKWAKLCPSEPEIGHALMRLVMTGHEVPHACEVELLILSHYFYMSSACLDGVDVLVTFAANRVESYVIEGDFSCLARLITGVSNFHSLSFILDILIENGQLELLLQKYSATDAATGTPASVRSFRMAVLTSLNHFNSNNDDAFSMVYKHFDMKHEAASLLESRSIQYMKDWLSRRDKERQNDELLDAMRHLIETAEVLSTIDAGQRTHRACARASLLSLQIRIPDLQWIGLSETNARRVFVEQSRFQEALIVAEAYNINQPSEWAPVLWNQMLKPDLIEQFIAEFVLVLPLQPQMLLEVARFYRAEVAARGDQSHFSVWLSPGGLPAEWVRHLGRSFRSLLRRTRDIRVRVQLATLATGFADVLDACNRILDKVPENAGPLILRRGHGGAYLPLM